MTTPRQPSSPRKNTRRNGSGSGPFPTGPAISLAIREASAVPSAPGEDDEDMNNICTLDPMPDRVRDLTSEQQGLVSGYLNQLKLDCGLTHWELSVDWDEQCEDDCDAQVSTVEGRYTAVLWLHDRFFTLARSEQRRVLTHELLHLHTAGVMTAARLGMKNLTKDTKTWVMGYVRDAEEHAVDALSRVVGTHLGLPPWGEPDSCDRVR